MYSNRNGFLSSIPPVTKNLMIMNVLLWGATIALDHSGHFNLETYLGLHYWQSSDFNAAQLITYMFMHDTSSVAHIFFNMFSLWMFGRIIEQALGSKRFLFYYLSCGLGAGLIQELTWMVTWQSLFVPAFAGINGLSEMQVSQMLSSGQLTEYVNQFYDQLVTIGASGAVFGVLLAFGMLFPNMPLYIIPFPFPIKAKWVVLGYGVIELLFGVESIMSNVAHFAHLGGMLVGILIILYWRHKGVIGRNGY